MAQDKLACLSIEAVPYIFFSLEPLKDVLVKVLVLLPNIRLGWKCLLETKSLAYFS
jgi:hypothetical protein